MLTLRLPLFGPAPHAPAEARPPQPRTEAIRTAMRAALADAPQHACLRHRIACCGDAQQLWHLRGELMQALGALHGERTAVLQLQMITALFEDVLPHLISTRRFS